MALQPLQPALPPPPAGPSATTAAHLRAVAEKAKAGEPEAQAELGEAARMLETHFVTWLLREMRRTVPEGGLLPRGPASDIYEQMLDDSLGKAIAQGSGLGIARAIEQQLAPSVARAPVSSQNHPTTTAPTTHATTGE